MGLQLVRVPRMVHGAQVGEPTLFTPDAVEWAMDVVLNGQGQSESHVVA